MVGNIAGRQHWPRRALWALPALIAAGYLVLSALSAPSLRFSNDSYRYAQTTLRVLGHGPDDAHRLALGAYCGAEADLAVRAARRSPDRFRQPPDRRALLDGCMRQNRHGLWPDDPRFAAIFAPRPGYPLIAVPFVALFGTSAGMWSTALLSSVAGGLLAYALLRTVGVSNRVAAAGQLLYYLCPLGYWGNWALAEGLANALTMGAMLGAWWMLTRRAATGVVLTGACLALGVSVKYSTFLLVAGALLATAAIGAGYDRRLRHRGTWALAGVSGLAVAGIVAMTALLRLPGTHETLQDTFTQHFTTPDVADPWSRLLELNGWFWQQWTQQQFAQPVLLVGLGLGAWGLWHRSRTLALLVSAVSATGVATEIAHPLASQGDRLIAPLWIGVVIGLPLLLAQRPGRSAERAFEHGDRPAVPAPTSATPRFTRQDDKPDIVLHSESSTPSPPL